jgi:hypothetical protein
MTTTTLTPITTSCPPWCHSHFERGETSDHYSALADTPLGAFGIQAYYETAGAPVHTVIYLGDDELSASEARQVAAVLLKLADRVEGPR